MFQGASQWYELQDLHVKEILPQMITLSDSYIQVTIQVYHMKYWSKYSTTNCVVASQFLKLLSPPPLDL
jgi:hypothetical protein